MVVDVEGNPNYVEVIEGTVNNPFGSSLKALEIFRSLASGTCSCYLDIDGISDSDGFATSLTGHIPYMNEPEFDPNKSDYQCIAFCFFATNGNILRSSRFAFIDYNEPAFVAFHAYSHLDSASNAELIDGSTPCTLTIIHHPLQT